MWERYSEPLSLDTLAGSAYLSRFYFSRLFRTKTGTSPGRFLTAIRLYQAKLQLRETELSVTDIAYGVGYNSLGTFISRFTRSVGVSPARYRALAHCGMPRLSGGDRGYSEPGGTIRGRLDLPVTAATVKVYIGVFPSPVVQGMPLACDIVDSYGDYELPDVPAGKWFLRAVAIGLPPDPRQGARCPQAVGAYDNVKVVPDETIDLDIHLHMTGVFDLPILIALPELDTLLPGAGQRRPLRPQARLAG